MRIRLDLSYDGTDFSGWAKQPDRRTVQGELEKACEAVLRLDEPARLTVAGRTDAGVHARGQVVHLDIPTQRWHSAPGRSTRTPGEALAHQLTAVLPPDVVVRQVAHVPQEFNARFSALWRRYSYTVMHTHDPLLRRYAHRHPPVDINLLEAASQELVGERDFTAFCKARPGASAVRTLEEFTWTTWQDGGSHGVTAHLRADAFCHNMVRSLIGAVLSVADGRRPLEWLVEVAGTLERSSSIQVAPAHALIMEEVGYPPAELLGQRAEQTRGLRTLS